MPQSYEPAVYAEFLHLLLIGIRDAARLDEAQALADCAHNLPRKLLLAAQEDWAERVEPALRRELADKAAMYGKDGPGWLKTRLDEAYRIVEATAGRSGAAVHG